MRVLVVRLSAMGDAAMCAPVLAAVCRQHPNVHFDFLSTPFFAPFFAHEPNFCFIGTNIRKEKGLLPLWRLYHKLTKEQKYDVVIDLHDVLRTRVLRTLFKMGSVPTYKIDKGRADKRHLTRLKNKDLRQLPTTISRYCDVFAQAGLTVELNHSAARQRLPMPEVAGLEPKGKNLWIGIAPFAQHKGKVYPLERMRRVIELLCQRPQIRVILFGGGATEKKIADEWAAHIPHCYSAIGKVKLESELALISNLDCMLSMDSSAMHMASLFGVRVVSVWGATHPYAGFLGFGQSHADVVQSKLPCRPCSVYGNKPCALGNYPCMDIEPEEIEERIIN